jgi:hypothetical protein
MQNAADSGPEASREAQAARDAEPSPPKAAEARPREIGGRKGPEPTRYGDWEKNGRCIDF